ncbi:hypothetical protein M8818_005408 [Zalaria obscura]|uniref:Uncharacterized protein n=1 Tax=Zalaria obscura TaxID=2024903 RepID=A0ACC3S7V1_9PEZI
MDSGELPEIFLQIPDLDNKGRYRTVEGICVLARNPSLHPGDVRVVQAVACPALQHLKNVVVLPQKGDRPLANMCSGGDLDGDDYLVIWDEDLIPSLSERNHEPMDYTPPDPIRAIGPVTVRDMTNFFVSYMKHDNLPFIAINHRVFADSLWDGVKSDKCIELAQLHSQAVDFAKTGAALDMHGIQDALIASEDEEEANTTPGAPSRQPKVTIYGLIIAEQRNAGLGHWSPIHRQVCMASSGCFQILRGDRKRLMVSQVPGA